MRGLKKTSLDVWTLLQIALTLAVLSVGAWKDWKCRQVSNKLWLVYGSCAFVLLLGQYGFSVLLGVSLLFSGLMAGAFYAVWWKFRGFIGGADAKALMCLSVSLPFWTPLVVGFSSMCAMGYVAITALVKGLTPKDVVRMKAPFLPFMYSGALLAILVLLWI